jgi:hypothetical protein
MFLGKLDICMQKAETRFMSLSTQSRLRTLIEGLKFETTTGSSRKYTEHQCIGSNFLNRTPMAQQMRERKNKWDCIKLKSFCRKNSHQTQETAHRMGENLCQLFT